MPERVSRVSAGIAVKASTMPGITKCCQVPVPEIGRTPSCRPSTIIRISAEPEARHRLPDHREQGDAAVDPGVLAHRRQDAERNRDDQRDAQADEAERERDRQALRIRFATLSLKK